MTVQDTENRFRYEGNGVTDTFSFPATIFSKSDLIIKLLVRSTDAVLDTLTLDTDYTVTIFQNGHASVQITNAPDIPSNTEDVLLERAVPYTQPLVLPVGTVFPAKDVEKEFDRNTVMIQQLRDASNRSLKFPSTALSTLDPVLPLPQDGYGIVWDGTNGEFRNTDAPLSVLEGDAAILAPIAAEIVIVAGIATEVVAVAGNEADISTVAGISAAVTGVSAIAADVVAVNANSANINTVATNIANVNIVANNMASVIDAANNIPKANRNATVDPTVNDDSGDGYSRGSQWVNQNNNTIWFLADPAPGAAIWTKQAGSLAGQSDVTILSPLRGDTLRYRTSDSMWHNFRSLGEQGTSIASAATTDIGSADSDYVIVTGTTTITSFGAVGSNFQRDHVWVQFAGSLTLTHNGTSLILPTGANIQTAAGDVAEMVRVSGSNWKCVDYQRATGFPVAKASTGQAQTGTATDVAMDPALTAAAIAELERTSAWTNITIPAGATSQVFPVVAGHDYEVKLINYYNNSGANDVFLQFSTDGGSTYIQTSYNGGSLNGFGANTANVSGSGTVNTNGFNIGPAAASPYINQIHSYLTGFNVGERPYCRAFSYVGDASTIYGSMRNFVNANALSNAVTNIRLVVSGGAQMGGGTLSYRRIKRA